MRSTKNPGGCDYILDSTCNFICLVLTLVYRIEQYYKYKEIIKEMAKKLKDATTKPMENVGKGLDDVHERQQRRKVT